MNDIDFDKLTEQAIGLFINYCEENNYKDKNINYYKNLLEFMEEEKKVGLLAKDFIKKLINREKELENTIFELGEQIKALKASKDNENNYIPLGYNIFLNMIKYARVSFNCGGALSMDVPTMSIDEYPIRADEMEYIQRLMNEREAENVVIGINRNMAATSYKSDRVDVGIGGSPRWQDNLANDRAWP